MSVAARHFLWYICTMNLQHELPPATGQPTHCWSLPLSLPPSVLDCHFGVHGATPMERYRLDGLWCMHLYQYVGEASIGGAEFAIRPGYVSLTPPNTELEHRWLHPGSTHISVHFLLEGTEARTAVPPMQDLGSRFHALYAALAEGTGWLPGNAARLNSRVWETLWQLSSDLPPAGPASALAPAVQKTVQHIERHLGETLTVASLAAAVGLSRNHLMRRFRAETGRSVAGYIRMRRVQRAHHLLAYSTLPVKAIAIQVGMPDLQAFNKMMHRHFHAAPRDVRAHGLQPEFPMD